MSRRTDPGLMPRPLRGPAPANPWQLADATDEGSMWLAWLIRLRWVAIIAQVLTLSFTFMVIDEPAVVLPLLCVAVAFLAGVNGLSLAHLRRGERVVQEHLLGQLLLDIGVLTVFFGVAGGTSNPFIMLFVVHVAMAAVMLRNAYALGVTALVSVINIGLHALYRPMHLDRHALPEPVLLSFGQTVAFTVTAFSVGAFVMGMASTLRRQKHRLLEARERSARNDRLRAVGTLAAGAAHELNTPLSTLGLRLRRVTRRHADDDSVKDFEVMRAQLDRCRQIVEQLLAGAGDPSASGLRRVVLQEVVRDGLKLWSKGVPVDIRFDDKADSPVFIEVPPVAFTQALINLVDNSRQAQESNGSDEPIWVVVSREGAFGVVTVRDRGIGLPEQADRVGEPFFTTKATGTGLGVFVARAVADGAGGGLRYDRVDAVTVTRWWFRETERSP